MNTESLDLQTFKRLSRIYSIAFGAIVLFTIGGQFLIQRYLSAQVNDSKIINISGRQRMLSQKLAKEIVLLTHVENTAAKQTILTNIKGTLTLWKRSHEELRAYNTSNTTNSENKQSIDSMFVILSPHFNTIYSNSKKALFLGKKDTLNSYQLSNHLDVIIENEPLFLKQMDAIVSAYEQDAKQRVSQLKRMEVFLFIGIILILLLEFFLLFRPVAFSIKTTISDLLIAQSTSKEMISRAEVLRKKQEENVQELVALTRALDQTLLYARVDQYGGIRSLGQRFAKLLRVEQQYIGEHLSELMQLSELQQHRLLQLIAQNKGGVFNEEFELQTADGILKWLDISILTVFKESETMERLVLCSDISKRKEAQLEIEKLQAAQYEEKEELQKSRASQIVEAQEEERKRIAKEIHDSIGQMLTALKMNIESINVNNIEKTQQKIDGLKKLSQDLIQGVRMATFNLTPPELKDYGISIALQKLARELQKLTDKTILVENRSDFDQRFNTLVETNLYRVTQEAVNNAIKYADAEYIIITINHTESVLSIMIDDNGKGFDMDTIPKKPKNNAEGGMGLFFMRERMAYINGRIFINTIIGKGTRISLNYTYV